MSVGGVIAVGRAQSKFKKPLKRKVATAIRTNVMVAEQLLVANAKARLQLGREAVLIQHYLTHSNWAVFLRVISWLSFSWGAYGAWIILKTGSPLFDDDVCDRIGFFTVSIKFWVTQYFSYLMVSVLHLSCNTLYVAVRRSKVGERMMRRWTNFKDEEHGLPVPLYELVLDNWVLNDEADEKTLANLARKNAEDEATFLAAKRKRLEEELEEVGSQLERSAAARGEEISSPSLTAVDRRRVTFLGNQGQAGSAGGGGGSTPIMRSRSRDATADNNETEAQSAAGRVAAARGRSPSRWGDLVRSSFGDVGLGSSQSEPEPEPELELEPEPEPEVEEGEPRQP